MNTSTRTRFALLLPLLFLLLGCATEKTQVGISQYRFNYNGYAYRIRSIASNHVEKPRNELIGPRVYATDLDQDRILDQIILGDESLINAQKIYDFGLEMLARENKLKELNTGMSQYSYETEGLSLEIRSFHPPDGAPFNEFKIIDSRPIIQRIIIVLDRDADGKLDEIVKGEASLDVLQTHYAQAIETGLQRHELVRVDNKILVKERES